MHKMDIEKGTPGKGVPNALFSDQGIQSIVEGH